MEGWTAKRLEEAISKVMGSQVRIVVVDTGSEYEVLAEARDIRNLYTRIHQLLTFMLPDRKFTLKTIRA